MGGSPHKGSLNTQAEICEAHFHSCHTKQAERRHGEAVQPMDAQPVKKEIMFFSFSQYLTFSLEYFTLGL